MVYIFGVIHINQPFNPYWKKLFESYPSRAMMPILPPFKKKRILKWHDLIHYHIALFMHKYTSNSLPPAFNNFFKPISKVHSYNTRLASKSSYYLPQSRTNYGLFNIRYKGVGIWNEIKTDLKSLSIKKFKRKLKLTYLETY